MQVHTGNKKLGSVLFKTILEEVRHSPGSDDEYKMDRFAKSCLSPTSSSISSPWLPLWVTTSLLISPGSFQCVFMQIKANVRLFIYPPLSHKRDHTLDVILT